MSDQGHGALALTNLPFLPTSISLKMPQPRKAASLGPQPWPLDEPQDTNMAAGPNPFQYLQQHIIPSSLTFLGNEYNADHSRGYNVEVDSP